MNDLTTEETRYLISTLSQTIERMDAKLAFYQGDVWGLEYQDMCSKRLAVSAIVEKLKNSVAIAAFDRN